MIYKNKYVIINNILILKEIDTMTATKQDLTNAKNLVNEMAHHEGYDSRVKNFLKDVRVLSLPKTIIATRLLIDEMTKEKGFTRHDGRDYFVHPIAVAQTALDFGIISRLMHEGRVELADEILATALLHDTIEDIDFITKEKLVRLFGNEIADEVDNVSKRKGEPFEDYIKRVSSNQVSALVKILDRLNNVSTLSHSTLEHRIKQYDETMAVYIPLTKIYRRKYWEYGDFFWQARTIMLSILAEVNRANVVEMNK